MPTLSLWITSVALLGFTVHVCVHNALSVCQRSSASSDTHECRPTPYTHRTMGSERKRLMDEQMNRDLNQYMDEVLDDVQECSFSYATI